MSGLMESQLNQIRGPRPLAPSVGDHDSQISKTGEASDESLSIVDGESPVKRDESPKPHRASNNIQLAAKFKVHCYSHEPEPTALVTFNNPWPSADWPSKKLTDLGQLLESHVKADYAFCLEDKSVVPCDMLVVDYFEETAQVADQRSDTAVDGEKRRAGNATTPLSKRLVHNIIYLKQNSKNDAMKKAVVDALQKPFLIKFVDKGGEGSPASIQSSELPADVNTVQLGALRPYVNMSNDHSRDEFCLSDGTKVGDSMLLKTYISKAEVPGDIDSELPMLTVFFQKVGRKSLFSEASAEMKERGNIDTKINLAFGPGNTKPVTAEEIASKSVDVSKLGLQQSFLESLSSVKAGGYVTPAELDEMQWSIVLSNCNALYGWKFDLNTMSVKRAPQPAFKLRKGLNLDIGSDAAPTSQNVVQTATRGDSALEAENSDDAGGNTATTPTIPFVSKRKKPDAIPRFCVTDDSKVDITVVSSTLEESMAKNNFTASSFEVGGSGSFLGIGFGGSVGTAQRQEAGTGNKSTEVETLMIGSYRFPRASVSLRAEDLEPTEGLASAIERVRVSKSLDQLRALYDTYGHFFCEEILIGGRLQTTRVTTVTDGYSISRAKSQFKTEVGAAISSPFVSMSSKYSKESGDDQENSKQQTNSRDAISFEATGGNTILATNPPVWTESVLDHRNWRVIERSGLTPLGQVLDRCSIAEVKQARAWFAQAVPCLSNYIAISESRVLPVRLKLNSKIPQLNHPENHVYDREVCYYLGHQYGKCIHPIRVGLQWSETSLTTVSQQIMLPGSQGIHPTIDISTTFLEEHKKTEEIPLFTPARFQAPVVLPYHDLYFANGVTEADYKETVWNMIVPYGKWLRHDSVVMLTSAAGTNQNNSVWLTVFRNTQGHFMPAMTSSGDATFWRVKRAGAGNGRELNEGSKIKLTWRFSDQTAGFRDFYGDSFGRRTFNKPLDVQVDELHLKLPFPGFQITANQNHAKGESAGLAMVMSDEGTDQPFLQELVISSKKGEGSQKVTYNLHDVSFRVDLVGNNGLGELKDYMTFGLNQSLSETVADTDTVQGTQWFDDNAMAKMDQAGTALFGPTFSQMSSPAKMVISRVSGF